MGLMTSSDAKIYVSTASPATRDETGYAALTYTEVKQITSVNPYGTMVSAVEFNTLSGGAKQTAKGQKDYGGVGGDYVYDSEDAGQNILRADVLTTTSELSVKIELPDGSVSYSGGPSLNAQRNIGSANNMINGTYDIRFNYEPVEVAA